MTRHQALAELNLSDPCTADDIRRAYKKRAMTTHPDKGGTQAAFKHTVDAYNHLISGQASTNGHQPKQQETASREDWMIQTYTIMAEHAARAGINLPSLRLSVGYGTSGRRKTWCVINAKHTHDGIQQAFITPEIDGTREVLDLIALATEKAIDTTDGKDNADAWTAIYSIARPSIENAAGPYPHSAVNKEKKTEGTRLLKATCNDCGYTIRVTKKWAEQYLPTCGQCGTEFELA